MAATYLLPNTVSPDVLLASIGVGLFLLAGTTSTYVVFSPDKNPPVGVGPVFYTVRLVVFGGLAFATFL